MPMICPDCRGTMVPLSGQTARCTVHGGQYQILFSRVMPASSADAAASADDQARRQLMAMAPPGVMCGWHPTVMATQRCQICGALVCNVCDFSTPTWGHLCPSCVTAPTAAIADRKTNHRKLLIWSYVLPGIATFAIVAISIIAALNIQDPNALEILGGIATLFLLVPSLIGLGLSISLRDKHSPYRGAAWGSLAWNGVILSGFVLLMILGLVSGGK